MYFQLLSCSHLRLALSLDQWSLFLSRCPTTYDCLLLGFGNYKSLPAYGWQQCSFHSPGLLHSYLGSWGFSHPHLWKLSLSNKLSGIIPFGECHLLPLGRLTDTNDQSSPPLWINFDRHFRFQLNCYLLSGALTAIPFHQHTQNYSANSLTSPDTYGPLHYGAYMFCGSYLLHVWFIPPFSHHTLSASRQASILLTFLFLVFCLLPVPFVSLTRSAMGSWARVTVSNNLQGASSSPQNSAYEV